MSYGVSIFAPDGQQKIGTNSKGLRALSTFLFPASTSGSVSVPGFNTNNGFISVVLYGTNNTNTSYSFDNSTETFSYVVAQEGPMQVVFFLTV